MNKINNKGMELIEYKSELTKDYPKLIKDSLILALEQMVENKIIDLDTYTNVKDDSFKAEAFNEYLHTKETFMKTQEEIFTEFELLREVLDSKLNEHEVLNIRTESITDRDSILVTRKFCIDEEFTIKYFGVEEKDLLKLMKRRGFIEKFAVLRLTVIFKALMESMDFPMELFKTDVSLVYFDKDENGYSIDFTFEIDVEEVENEVNLDEICEKINEIKTKVEEVYKEKTEI